LNLSAFGNPKGQRHKPLSFLFEESIPLLSGTDLLK